MCKMIDINILIENNEMRQEMSLKGWEHVKAKYHYQHLVNNMSVLYNKLLSSGTI